MSPLHNFKPLFQASPIPLSYSEMIFIFFNLNDLIKLTVLSEDPPSITITSKFLYFCFCKLEIVFFMVLLEL